MICFSLDHQIRIDLSFMLLELKIDIDLSAASVYVIDLNSLNITD